MKVQLGGDNFSKRPRVASKNFLYGLFKGLALAAEIDSSQPVAELKKQPNGPKLILWLQNMATLKLLPRKMGSLKEVKP